MKGEPLLCLCEERNCEGTGEDGNDGNTHRRSTIGRGATSSSCAAAAGGAGCARRAACTARGLLAAARGGASTGTAGGRRTRSRDGIGEEGGRGGLHTVARRDRSGGRVGYAGDRTKGLRGLCVRLSRARGIGVDTGNDHVIRVADLKVTGLHAAAKSVLGRTVVGEADMVKGVLAVARVVLALGIANLEAELAIANESVERIEFRITTRQQAQYSLSPPENLRGVTGERGGVDETADGVTLL